MPPKHSSDWRKCLPPRSTHLIDFRPKRKQQQPGCEFEPLLVLLGNITRAWSRFVSQTPHRVSPFEHRVSCCGAFTCKSGARHDPLEVTVQMHLLSTRATRRETTHRVFRVRLYSLCDALWPTVALLGVGKQTHGRGALNSTHVIRSPRVELRRS